MKTYEREEKITLTSGWRGEEGRGEGGEREGRGRRGEREGRNSEWSVNE
jgi:hypothetical protein